MVAFGSPSDPLSRENTRDGTEAPVNGDAQTFFTETVGGERLRVRLSRDINLEGAFCYRIQLVSAKGAL